MRFRLFSLADFKYARSRLPSKWPLFGRRNRKGGRFEASGITLKFLIEQAYDVKDPQISGGPDWINFDRYDFEAKADGTVSSAKYKVLIQSLLTDRFKLGLVHQIREPSVDALVLAKNGPKFRQSNDKVPVTPGFHVTGPDNLSITGNGLTSFAQVLSRMTGRIVRDKTGLSGKYDLTLHWNPQESEGSAFGGPRQDPVPTPSSDSTGPSLVAALREQLGLKLVSGKAPVTILVIQHVEKPSEN